MTGQKFKAILDSKTNIQNVYIIETIDSAMIDLYIHRYKLSLDANKVVFGQFVPDMKLLKQTVVSVNNYKNLKDIPTNIFEYDNRYHILCFVENVDKRASLYKQYKDRFIEISNDYTKYIMDNSNLSKEEAIVFAKASNNDFGIIKSRLDTYKLSNYSYNRFTNYHSDRYEWVENFIKKQPLPKVVDSPISVMALLSTNCQNILKVKQNDTKGMNPYVIKCLQPLLNCRTESELVHIINDCFYLDCNIKKGLIDVDDTLKILIRKYK